MAIEFNCPVCGGLLRVDEDSVGQVVRCGGCLSMLRVPDSKPGASEFPNAPSTPFTENEPRSAEASPPSPPSRNPRLDSSPGNPQPDSPVDEPPRPVRRKRRQPPPPPSGRSPLFWVAITLGVLGFGSCVLCCGLGSWLQDVHWRTADFPRGGFRVELPGAPSKHMAISGWDADPSWTIEGARMMNTGEEFAVLYKDIQPTDQRGVNSDEAILRKTLQDRKAAPGVRNFVESKTVVEQCGFPAREFRYGDLIGEGFVVRVIVADSRMYILVVCGTAGEPDEDDVHHFFDSFEITDPKLLATAEARKEEARRLAQRRVEDGLVLAIGKIVEEVIFEQAAEAQLGSFGKALGVAAVQSVSAELSRVQAEAQRRIAALASAVTTAAWRLAAAEQRRAQVVALGAELTATTLGAVEGERQRLRMLHVGKLAATASFAAVASDQAAAHDRRSRDAGIAIGSTISSAVVKALGRLEK